VEAVASELIGSDNGHIGNKETQNRGLETVYICVLIAKDYKRRGRREAVKRRCCAPEIIATSSNRRRENGVKKKICDCATAMYLYYDPC
jgi:hypothetical protein